MVNNINGISNLNAATTAEYPSGSNGQTFSINGGFQFTLTFDTTEVGDNGQYCLIQLVNASERILANANYRQTSNFANLPVLDGDVMQEQEFWYSNGTIIQVNEPGNDKIILPDDPQTSPVDGFYGPPTALTVAEQFVILFARYLGEGNYEQIAQWTWKYGDNSNRNGGVWQQGNFNHDFQQSEIEINLDNFNGEVRANNQVQTHVEQLR